MHIPWSWTHYAPRAGALGTYHGHGHTTHPVQAHWAQQQLNDRQPVGAVKLSRHPSQSEASPLKLKGLSYSFLLDEVMLADEH